MKNFLSLIFSLAFLSVIAADDNRYVYYIDLTNVVEDKVMVSLEVPEISENEVTFYMPVIIPGTYAIADYGRFVSDFKAFDKKGRELKATKTDDNTWVISKAKKLTRITYWVDDSWDFEGEGPNIFEPAGTNIEEDKNFVINTAGFFGYFKSMKNLPVQVNIIRDKDFYGGTGLIPRPELQMAASTSRIAMDFLDTESEETVDSYVADNYDHLIDSPIMYAEADTAVLKVANTEVLVTSYSPNKVVTAKEIAATIRETLAAQTDYLGGQLPVDKYAFIFYFMDKPLFSYGALEHSYSSFYYMPETTIGDMEQQLRDFAAHEFFHIITPLTIHSEEIHRFDFNDPRMSKHLWLYEGVTEYFAGHAQVSSGLIGVPQYINMLREKLIISTTNFNDSLAFTELSKGALDQHEDQYINVYQKGALIGMCLDIKLRSLSSGEMGLRDLVLKLSEKYGKGSFFEDDELFDVMAELSYPEIREFFTQHVENGTPIPYEEYFGLVGIQFEMEATVKNLSMGFGQNNINFDPVAGTIFITNDDQLNEFGQKLGLKNDDVILAMNDQELPPLGPETQQFIVGIIQSLREGEEFSITVNRKNEAGEMEEVRLAAENFMVDSIQMFLISPMEDATEEQLNLRQNWLNAE